MVRIAGRLHYAPRVALAIAGVTIGDKRALHKCHLAACVNAQHLYVGTQSENLIDAVRAGRAPDQKLDVEKVREIRRLAPTTRICALARRFGVTATQIGHIVSRRQWKFVDAA